MFDCHRRRFTVPLVVVNRARGVTAWAAFGARGRPDPRRALARARSSQIAAAICGYGGGAQTRVIALWRRRAARPVK